MGIYCLFRHKTSKSIPYWKTCALLLISQDDKVSAGIQSKKMKTWAELLKGIVYAHVFMCKRITGAQAIFKPQSAHKGAFCRCEIEC